MISICFILFLLISILTSSYGQVTCPSGWVLNGGSCYLIKPAYNSGTTAGTWDQCNAWCLGVYPGAMMVCINNAAEDAWVRTKLNDWYYIGYTDMPPYGGGKGTKQYGWVTGCSSTYTNWASGQPDNQNNMQDYAVVHNSGFWIDYEPTGFSCVCEIYSLTTTPTSRPTTASSTHPSTVSSFRLTVAPLSGSTSSPTETPSFTFSVEDVSE